MSLRELYEQSKFFVNQHERLLLLTLGVVLLLVFYQHQERKVYFYLTGLSLLLTGALYGRRLEIDKQRKREGVYMDIDDFQKINGKEG